MRHISITIIFLACILSASAKCQITSGGSFPNESKAQKAIRAAAGFEAKLADSSVTLDQAIENWRSTAANPDVKSDTNSLAIALGSEGLLEIQKGNTVRADSLLGKAMQLFRRRLAKAPFLVQFAELERSLNKNAVAMRAYDEIVNTMDSVGGLWYIEYYRLSGYAPFAYGIGASFGIEQIASRDTAFRKKAILILTSAMNRHPSDALGMMAVVALHRLGAITDDSYKFHVDLLSSRKPELRNVCDIFEKKFSEAK